MHWLQDIYQANTLEKLEAGLDSLSGWYKGAAHQVTRLEEERHGLGTLSEPLTAQIAAFRGMQANIDEITALMPEDY